MPNAAPSAVHSAPLKFILAGVIIIATIAWLAFSGAQQSKSYYVTIGEMQGLGDKAYTRHLRVAGNVQPGSIERVGTNATFTLVEQEHCARGDVPAQPVL